MAVQKRAGSWRCIFQRNGKVEAHPCFDPKTGATASSRSDAKRIEKLIKAHLTVEGDKARAKLRAPETCSLGRVMALYLKAKTGTDDEKNANRYVADLIEFFGVERDAATIGRSDFDSYREWALKQPIRVYLGAGLTPEQAAKREATGTALWRETDRTRSASTVRLYWKALKAALRIAHESRDPVTGARLLAEVPALPNIKAPKRKARPIPQGDIGRIIAEAPSHVRDAAILSSQMAFRRAEVFALTTEHVDRERFGVWLRAEETKANEDAFMPANAIAWDVLDRLYVAAIGREPHPDPTFGETATRKHLIVYVPNAGRVTTGKYVGVKKSIPRPIRHPTTAWRSLQRRLGIMGKHRWHDLKAAFVSAVGKVASGPTTQALARHADFATTQGYLAVEDPELRAAVDAVAKRSPVVAAATAAVRAGKSETKVVPLRDRPGSRSYQKVIPSRDGHEGNGE
jgi:integrase